MTTPDPLAAIEAVKGECSSWCRNRSTHHEWCGCGIAAKLDAALVGLREELERYSDALGACQAQGGGYLRENGELRAALAEKGREIAALRERYETLSADYDLNLKDHRAALADRDRRIAELGDVMQNVWGQMARSWNGESRVEDGSMPSWIAMLNEALKEQP